jgi:hypothetical protein
MAWRDPSLRLDAECRAVDTPAIGELLHDLVHQIHGADGDTIRVLHVPSA